MDFFLAYGYSLWYNGGMNFVRKDVYVLVDRLLWIGPWNLDPCRTGRRFDIKRFIGDAEAGKYDGEEPAFLDRRSPWYRQLKLDVEAGVYDDARLADEREVFQKWRKHHLFFNPRPARTEPVNGLRHLFLISNPWAMHAMAVAGWLPKELQMTEYSIMDNFMRRPNSGWRK